VSIPALGLRPLPSQMGTGGPFPGGKARPRRDADHSPPSSSEVVNEYELHLLSYLRLHTCVVGLLYLYEKIFLYVTILVCTASVQNFKTKRSVVRQRYQALRMDANAPKNVLLM
jgi:hypothetical protein